MVFLSAVAGCSNVTCKLHTASWIEEGDWGHIVDRRGVSGDGSLPCPAIPVEGHIGEGAESDFAVLSYWTQVVTLGKADAGVVAGPLYEGRIFGPANCHPRLSNAAAAMSRAALLVSTVTTTANL